MGLAKQDEIEKAIIEAKKKLSDDEIIEVLKKCSYGGKPVSMDSKGGDMKYGKADRSAVSEDKPIYQDPCKCQ
jgi:hypothetical protein